MPASRAVTADGLPHGVAAVKFWTRKMLKGTVAPKWKINLTRLPIEREERLQPLEKVRQSSEPLGEPERSGPRLTRWWEMALG